MPVEHAIGNDVFVHESAYVDEPCEIGEGTKIWHFTHVMKNCRIGRKCNIGQNVVVSPDVTIGDGCKIQNNVSLYTGVVLEDFVFCGPSMVFTNVVNPRSEINRRNEYRQTRVGRGTTFGANCTVVCGHDIGKYAFVAAGAVVTKNVPDYALMLGVPARRVGWACRCGDRLPAAGAGGRTFCSSCGNEYHEQGENLSPVREVQDRVNP
ncbi:MAG: N-acetyltransferase [Leptolyngbya sp. PLA3]|nr:MAG: N-acetyltransferase [Cyanobacteria bacterium CYA]MCE7967824.1 N-acetyltransferase [Leptolyngbya sp. PL-A3]